MKIYIIRDKGESYAVIERATGEVLATYRHYRDPITGRQTNNIPAMRRALDAHIANGGTLSNYQW
jgi:hypothetical protein